MNFGLFVMGTASSAPDEMGIDVLTGRNAARRGRGPVMPEGGIQRHHEARLVTSSHMGETGPDMGICTGSLKAFSEQANPLLPQLPGAAAAAPAP